MAADTYKTNSVSVNATDADIQTMARSVDYGELMQSNCPHECAWAVNFEWVQKNLFRLPA